MRAASPGSSATTMPASRCAASPSRPSRSRSGKELSAIMRRAFTRLRSGRGGPVLVEVPNDVWNEEPTPSDYVVSRPLRRSRPGGDPRGREDAARRQAPGALCRPGRALGGSVGRAEGSSPNCSPFRSPPACRARARSPRTHPLSLGSGGLAIPAPVHHFLRECRSHPRHRLLVHRRRTSASRCRPARRSSMRRSIRPT